MSSASSGRPLPQISCAITRTNRQTHDIIRAALDRSPLFTGAIAASGPRYCPSIEDKIHRFGDRDGHQVFLEPEGLDDPLVYPNGISTSLPRSAQADLVASIPGLERARIVAPGYAVEYDFLDPRALERTLACSAVERLFCAGQINGTTGYEEAAAQGLVAGANAAADALSLEPLVLDRSDGYLGVLIDDLVLQGVTEPYRMLTARAEFRLRLRADNAETRLAPIAAALGCLSADRLARLERRVGHRREINQRLAIQHTASELAGRGAGIGGDGGKRSGAEWLRFPGVDVSHVIVDPADLDPQILAEAAEDARYAPYLERQAAEVADLKRNEAIPLASDIDYRGIAGLSLEMVDRLSAAKPDTLAAAGRIRGITPAALTAILLHLRRRAA
jgi:tRNA uridine 5-carboxymethylaminomethyl modification enzyme